ncbi:hypothetical protein [Nocardia sp. NPDC059239]|uniref:hypothetical protein n=1 Tax=unclassified Nocardia TaxID=2637762 RepID=UPI0036BA0680
MAELHRNSRRVERLIARGRLAFEQLGQGQQARCPHEELAGNDIELWVCAKCGAEVIGRG